jgi:hypothetical protein
MKKLLMVLFLILLCPALFGQTLTRLSSHDSSVTRMSKTGYWNPLTQTWTDIQGTSSMHVIAVHNKEMNGIRYDTTLDTGQEGYLLIYAPGAGEGEIHLLWEIEPLGAGQLNFYYATASDVTAGDSIPISNMFVGADIDPETTAFTGAGITSFGNKLPVGGSLGSGKKQGGNFAAGEELLIGDDYVIIVELCSLSNGNIITSRLWWHRTPENKLP